MADSGNFYHPQDFPGVPVVPVDNEDDRTPLQRAAWMEYYAAFFNLEANATQLLNQITVYLLYRDMRNKNNI